MLKKVISYILTGVVSFGIGIGVKAIPENIHENSQLTDIQQLTNSNILATLWQQQSGEVKALRYQAYNSAIRYIDEIMKTPSEKQYAVTLDLDETVIDNSLHAGYVIKNYELFSRENFKEWTNKASASAVEGAKNFTDYAKSKGLEVFYVSNRNQDELDSTIKNMINLGFINADKEHIILKTDTNDKGTRWNVLKEKYNLAIYCGDNLGDFFEISEGATNEKRRNLVDKYFKDFGTKFIVLPNPVYGDFEGAIYNYDYSKSPKEKLYDRMKNINSFR